MTDAYPLLPESMQPIVDTRAIAADLTYARWLLDVSQGKVSAQEESEYVRPVANDFEPEGADELVIDTLAWIFSDSQEGLGALVHFSTTIVLFERAANLATRLHGLDIGSVRSVIDELGLHEQALSDLYKESRGSEETGDQTVWNEKWLVLHAKNALYDLIIPGNEAIKEVLFSGRVGTGWANLFD